MNFFNHHYENNYDELITYYPRFYREVREMVVILKAHGDVADNLEAGIERIYNNCFIDEADEQTIEKLEAFLDVGLNKQRTLEERRRLVKSYFVGFGKVSASMLKEMIQSYTNAGVDIYFEPFDEERNNMLHIDFERGSEDTIYMDDILELLAKKIPAHIAYRANVVYRFPIGIGRSRAYYGYDYKYCGTLPNPALIGEAFTFLSGAQKKRSQARSVFPQADEEAEAGTYPADTKIGLLRGAEAANLPSYEHGLAIYPLTQNEGKEAGLEPSETYIGAINDIDAGAGITITDFGVDYIFCGEEYSQS